MNRIPLVSLLAVCLVFVAAGPASAHVTKPSGDYMIKVGWATEPPASDARNGITVEVWNTGSNEGVRGLKDTLKVSAVHAGASKDLDIEESDEAPGNYSAPLLPTQPGIYTIHVTGKINNDTAVSLDFVLEEVQDGNDAAFPAQNESADALAAKVASLESRVAALEAKATTKSNTPAEVSPTSTSKGVPALGLGVVLVSSLALAVALRRRA